jgi:hypothetical protein
MTRPAPAKPPAPGEVPHSWPVSKWPVGVFPNDPGDARNLVRFFRTELLAARALTRVGRRLVVMGDRYDAWLRSRIGQVEAFETPFGHGGDGV